MDPNAIKILYTYLDIPNIYKLLQVSKVFLEVYRKLDVKILLDKTSNKLEKYLCYVNFNKYLPKQKSQEWLVNRKGSIIKPPIIGGSEMYTLISSPRTLAMSKLKLTSFKGNIYTLWGNIFEPVISNTFDILFQPQNKEFELGSIPGLRDEEQNIISAYSPDKIMVVNDSRIAKVLSSKINFAKVSTEKTEKTESIVLVEFKCPAVGIPDGTIPTKYSLQPITGYCTIPIIDKVLFSNVVFRKISISDFNFGVEYDKDFHAKDDEALFDKINAIGFIGFYESISTKKGDIDLYKITDEFTKFIHEYINDLGFISAVDLCYKLIALKYRTLCFVDQYAIIKQILSFYHKSYTDDAFDQLSKICYRASSNFGIDYGGGSSAELYSLFTKTIDNNEYKMWNSEILFSDENRAEFGLLEKTDLIYGKQKYKFWINSEERRFVEFCKVGGFKPIGILPWKMFKLAIIPVPLDPLFLENTKPKIVEITKNIQQIRIRASELKVAPGEFSDFCLAEVDKIYPAKRASKKKSYSEPKVEVNDSILTEFADLE
jgi:hypothetical protein